MVVVLVDVVVVELVVVVLLVVVVVLELVVVVGGGRCFANAGDASANMISAAHKPTGTTTRRNFATVVASMALRWLQALRRSRCSTRSAFRLAQPTESQSGSDWYLGEWKNQVGYTDQPTTADPRRTNVNGTMSQQPIGWSSWFRPSRCPTGESPSAV